MGKKNFEEIIELILPKIEVKVETWTPQNIDRRAMQLAGLKTDKITEEKGTIFNVVYDKTTDGFNVRKDEGNGILKIHTGVDISYGKDKTLTYVHPKVYSPVSGIIVKIINEENKKEIRIKAKIGEKGKEKEYLHILEHFDSIENGFREGMTIAAGKAIGSMGGRGRTGRYHYHQHLHYEIRTKAYDLKNDFLSANLSEGIDNIVEKGDMMYLDPEAFWNSKEENAIPGFIKSKEPQIEEGPSKKKEVRKEIKIERGELVKEKNVKNGKTEEVVYQFGEIEFNGKKWKTIEKGPIPNGVSWETIYKKYKAEHVKKNFLKRFWDEDINRQTWGEISRYNINAGAYYFAFAQNGLEIIDKSKRTITSGESTNSFTEESDIFVCQNIKRVPEDKSKPFQYYKFENSKTALEELMTSLEESVGDNKPKFIVKIGKAEQKANSEKINSKLSRDYPMEEDVNKWIVFCSGVNSNIDPVFLRRLAAIARDFNKKIILSDGFRTFKQQEAIFLKHGGTKDKITGKYTKPKKWKGSEVAVPGNGYHEFGLAIDTSSDWLQAINFEEKSNMQTTLKKYGIHKPITKGNFPGKKKWEDWHIEPYETVDMRNRKANPAEKEEYRKAFQEVR